MPRALAALALLFLAAHLVLLPGTLGDIDSINFALGVRDFDVAQHQPHPPGYPLYIGLAKLSTSVFEWMQVQGPEARGLAFWGAVAGTALVPLLFSLFRMLDGSRRIAAWATALTVMTPLVWFTSLRPLSDVTGLAAAVGTQLLLLMAAAKPSSSRLLIAGAFASGLTVGFRSQTFLLTLPLLGYVLVSARPPSAARWLSAGAAGALGVLVWGVPLVLANGGLSTYLEALGQQGSEDFSGVVMFWNMPTLRVGLAALQHTFISPWATPWLAAAVLTAAAIGITTLFEHRRTALLVGLLTVPYLVFHLIFQETRTVRYSLPVVPMIAWVAVRGLDRISAGAVAPVTTAFIVYGLALSVPATIGYSRVPPPIFRAMADLAVANRVTPVTVAGHRRVFSESRRVREWLNQTPGVWLPSPVGREWLQLTEAWRSGRAGTAWFLANPQRTDLALLDRSEAVVSEYRWPFDSSVFAGGARPDEFDAYVFSRPAGWFLEEGWAITPEVAGKTFRDGGGPHVRESVGWIRRREEEVEMVLGGRHLGPPGSPAVRLIATIDGRQVLDRRLESGFFADRLTLPAGSLTGSGAYAQLLVRATAADGSVQPVSLEHFDVQSTGVPMFAFGDGWYEPEQERSTGRQWRWMSPQAELWVRPVGRDVRLKISAESPVRYFDEPPALRLGAEDTVLARLSPSADFQWEVVVPSDQLARAGGKLWIESDRQFVPGEGDPGGDQRRLALRVFSVAVH